MGGGHSRELAQYVSSPVPGIYVACCCCSGVFDTCRGSFTLVRSPRHIYSDRSRVTAFRCSGFSDGRLQVRWVREYDSPASPSTLTSPSLCLNLDTLSSDGSAGPVDVSAHPICISDVSIQSGDLDQVLSGDDLPSSVHVDCRLLHRSVTLTAESSAPISLNCV